MKSLLITIFLFFSLSGLFAQNAENTAAIPRYPYQFKVQWDNDMFARTDYYFTNGAEFELMGNYLKIDFLEHILNTPFTLTNKSYGFSIRQNMYTPKYTHLTEIQYNDRPYAGTLFAEYKTISQNNSRRFTASLMLGILGEYSGAAYTQTLVHSMDHLSIPQGWQYQLHNSAVVNLTYRHQQHIVNTPFFNLQYGLQGRVGTMYTDVEPEVTVRLGYIQSEFDQLSLMPNGKFETYLYATAGSRISFYDATLQGSLFSNKNSQHFLSANEKEMFVHSLTVGYVFSYQFVQLSASMVNISPEIVNGLSHSWGEVAIRVFF